ncbi:MAG: restriction endonuclease [Sphingobium sp.]|uniref:restriction endonuclease n=1 Tax=Sphingomonadales TaxID=204457 RepID=UPI000A029F08|nr:MULTISPECIES: restriction endonuclease [Sphingomonadaceae]MDF0489252.1 restriction endonuclease [Sphingomonas pollutisoli]MDF0544045.1 restriction endonuclease [Sphingobium arseniciresistens]MDX3899869.1 restriction endonuclease [Sphingobium sp.]
MIAEKSIRAAVLTLTAATISTVPAQAKSGFLEPHHHYLWIFFISLVLIAWLGRRLRVPIRHRWRHRQARTMFLQLQGADRGQPPGVIYSRLRGMDPLAFEELLLECFERRGCGVVRNRRYTGDGGLDGKVIIQGRTWLIQAKRYASAIRPEHVDGFATLCRSKGMPGLFIHTGRTGPSSRVLFDHHTHIEVISGERLLAPIQGDPLMIMGVDI